MAESSKPKPETKQTVAGFAATFTDNPFDQKRIAKRFDDLKRRGHELVKFRENHHQYSRDETAAFTKRVVDTLVEKGIAARCKPEEIAQLVCESAERQRVAVKGKGARASRAFELDLLAEEHGEKTIEKLNSTR